MQIPNTSSLHWRLWLIILIAVTPPLLIGIVEHQRVRAEAVETIRLSIDNLLSAAEAAERHAVRDVGVMMRIMANASDMRELDAEACSGLARRLRQALPGFVNLGAATPNGAVFCSAESSSSSIDVYDRQWFQSTLDTQRLTNGELVVGRITKRISVTFGYPLRDENGELKAALFAALGSYWFDRLLGSYGLPEDWEASLFSRNGHILARYPVDRSTAPDYVPVEVIDAFVRLAGGVGEVAGLDGKSRLYGVSKVHFAPDDLLVAIGAPVDQSLATIDQRYLYRAATLLLVAFMSALLARLFVRRLIEDWIDKLQHTIERIAHGDLNTRVSPASAIQEFSALETGINDMAASLRLREEDLLKLSTAIEQSPGSIVITDTDGRIEYVNEAFLRTTGYSREEVIGENPRILNSGLTPESVYQHLWSTLPKGEVWRGEFHNTRKDGSHYIEMATIAPIRRADGTITHYVAAKEDITLRRKSEALLERLAYYDALTGLANRNLLRDRLAHAVASGARAQSHGMLLMMDVDRFKLLNDTLGHEAGDKLLCEIAQRLRHCVREEDTIARLGDDDFAVLVGHIGATATDALTHAEQIAHKIERSLAAPYDLLGDGSAHVATLSMGLTLFKGRDTAAETISQQAEVALDQAKRDGRNTYRFFNPDMQKMVETHVRMERAVRAAIENEGFTLHYQPQFDRAGKLVGAEALIRWLDDAGKPISPADFIPLAEETGLIIPVGRWVMAQAARQLARWQRESVTAHLSIAVNVSARQFLHPEFVEQTASIVADSGIEPGGFKLELTESVFLRDPEEAIRRMLLLREIGLVLALDDFGIGYSSLSYLKNLPFDQLKIDQSFVADMLEDRNSMNIVRAIITMSESLGLAVVAEGVETQEQHHALESLGCPCYQGYLFGRPAPIEQWPDQWFSPRGQTGT